LSAARLRGGLLLVNPSVAHQHCAKVSPMLSIKQYLFAMRRSCKQHSTFFAAQTTVCASREGSWSSGVLVVGEDFFDGVSGYADGYVVGV
jgi:hypothetical protein